MVTKDGLVKILDFGLAKLTSTMSGSGEGSQLPTMTGTTPGVVVGTVGYMSPEQASGEPLDFRSDQFAFGSILYEMATGKRAFQKKTAVETLAAILNEDPSRSPWSIRRRRRRCAGSSSAAWPRSRTAATPRPRTWRASSRASATTCPRQDSGWGAGLGPASSGGSLESSGRSRCPRCGVPHRREVALEDSSGSPALVSATHVPAWLRQPGAVFARRPNDRLQCPLGRRAPHIFLTRPEAPELLSGSVSLTPTWLRFLREASWP